MPYARRDDPDTSHQAAEKASKTSDILRDRVRRVMENHGDWMTHEEIFRAYHRTALTRDWPIASESGVRTRVRELMTEGIAERDPWATVKNTNGNRVHQWRYVPDPAARQRNKDRYLADKELAEYHLPQIKAEASARKQQNTARYATETEHLDNLPLDTAIITEGPYPTIYQQTHTGRWAAPGTTARITVNDIILPARVLYTPEDANVDLTQFPTTPDTP